jgi:hypothetical protein
MAFSRAITSGGVAAARCSAAMIAWCEPDQLHHDTIADTQTTRRT